MNRHERRAAAATKPKASAATLKDGDDGHHAGLALVEIRLDPSCESSVVELRRLAAGIIPRSEDGHHLIYASVLGYDDDPRELHEVPEVTALMNRVIESEFFAWLRPNEPYETAEQRVPHLLGGWDVWALAHGLFRPLYEVDADGKRVRGAMRGEGADVDAYFRAVNAVIGRGDETP
jgi:hypothetical protein